MSSFILRFICLLSGILLFGCASHQSLYEKRPAHYAYIFGDVKGEHIDKAHASEVYATPASCQKSITALLALKTLGPDFQYETKLFVTKSQGQIQDVVIAFAGDPNLTHDQLYALLSPLKNTKIPGTLFLDASLFKVPEYSPNNMIGDIGTDYSQAVSSMNIDKNLVTINISDTITNDAGYQLINTVSTSTEPTKIRFRWDGQTILAMGNLHEGDAPLEKQISPEGVDQFALMKINGIMNALNITGNVKIIRDATLLPGNLTQINTVRSEPLATVLVPALKESDNLIFDAWYLRTMMAVKPEGLATWSDGDEIIKSLVQEYYSVDMTGAFFVDGSGMSRYNRIQPKQLYELLKQAYANTDFKQALPYPGEADSTLEKRLGLPSNIRAKTGNMTGITCLSGYAEFEQEPKVFVIMVNSFVPPSSEMFTIVDDFIAESY